MPTAVIHQRTVIRQTVRTLLLGVTDAGPRVEASRVLPYRRNELPAIGVYTIEETVESDSDTTAPRELTRKLRVEIAGWVAPGPGGVVDDAMDELAQQIETAMHADPFLGGAVGDSLLESTNMSLRADGESIMGIVTLSYGVTYRTTAPDTTVSDAALGNFLRADSKYQPAGPPTDANLPEDLFTVRTP